jgi:uncharacterized membrane protein YeaQ/YmgE (transglycosylase-associated protein family)
MVQKGRVLENKGILTHEVLGLIGGVVGTWD